MQTLHFLRARAAAATAVLLVSCPTRHGTPDTNPPLSESARGYFAPSPARPRPSAKHSTRARPRARTFERKANIGTPASLHVERYPNKTIASPLPTSYQSFKWFVRTTTASKAPAAPHNNRKKSSTAWTVSSQLKLDGAPRARPVSAPHPSTTGPCATALPIFR